MFGRLCLENGVVMGWLLDPEESCLFECKQLGASI